MLSKRMANVCGTFIFTLVKGEFKSKYNIYVTFASKYTRYKCSSFHQLRQRKFRALNCTTFAQLAKLRKSIFSSSVYIRYFHHKQLLQNVVNISTFVEE